jgi:hypothetical protein
MKILDAHRNLSELKKQRSLDKELHVKIGRVLSLDAILFQGQYDEIFYFRFLVAVSISGSLGEDGP